MTVAKKEFWFGNGEMTITAQVGKTLFTPGEEVVIDVFVNNTSLKPVEKTVVSLIRAEDWKFPTSAIETYAPESVQCRLRLASLVGSR